MLLGIVAAATLTMAVSPTGKATPTPPALVYATPAPQPTPNGSLVLNTATPTHGQPVMFTEMEQNAQVLVNGNFVGNISAAGTFTITFPNAGTYLINVGDYPQQTLVVN